MKTTPAATKIMFMINPLALESLYTLSTLAPSSAMTLYVNIRPITLVAELIPVQEFGKIVKQNVRWIPARGLRGGNNDHSDVKAPRGHGTSVLSKAAGTKYGVAKRITPVIVRIPSFQAMGDPAAWLDAVRDVYNDWEPTFKKSVRLPRRVMM
jgi:hypothetical protein